MNVPSAGVAPRLWPGVAIVGLQWLVRFAVPALWPGASMYAVLGGLAGGVAVLVWWLFFSRIPLADRWGAVLLAAAAMAATSRIVHESIATGMMGLLLAIYSIPVLSLVLVLATVLAQRLPGGWRRLVMASLILLACGLFALLRTGGITGGASSDFAWRWSQTSEERLLVEASLPLPAPPTVPAAGLDRADRQPLDPAGTPVPQPEAADWPGFRGPGRDGVIPGTGIRTDWSTAQPVELWRRSVGPAWSSFAVSAGRLYTQEQRGEEELVTCYDAQTGEPLWAHRDAARFWESNGGAGPRGTPTVAGGRVYALGATGILNALDAATGAAIWSRNAAEDTGSKVPGWGFSSSPLVIDDLVVVAADSQLAAYDAVSGAMRWSASAGGGSYSSPHLWTPPGGSPQLLLMSSHGLTGFAPADGGILWKYGWRSGDRIVQPAAMPEGDLLVGGADMDGIRRIALTPGPDAWSVEDRWESRGLKPYFNDFVIHAGHIFGFDGAILTCLDVNNGRRKWKGGRYGHGQLVLLRDEGVLLVLSEEGELALVRAAADGFEELARFPALEGKTWNHPVLVGDRLYVRNGQEMAAFRLPRRRE
ncbi:MAG: PQQ-binding-like beta-propeller repeat protein [Bryobacterales bacterium]|nr:PQQ-binding-like beta-propeller repeat protein [Bryobacterales bacterium]